MSNFMKLTNLFASITVSKMDTFTNAKTWFYNETFLVSPTHTTKDLMKFFTYSNQNNPFGFRWNKTNKSITIFVTDEPLTKTNNEVCQEKYLKTWLSKILKNGEIVLSHVSPKKKAKKSLEYLYIIKLEIKEITTEIKKEIVPESQEEGWIEVSKKQKKKPLKKNSERSKKEIKPLFKQDQ